MVSDFSLPVSLMPVSLLINHQKGSSSEHCCINTPLLTSILNVSHSPEGAMAVLVHVIGYVKDKIIDVKN